MNKVRFCIIFVFISLIAVVRGLDRELEYALEDAAFKTIKELTIRNIMVQRIAFVGLSGNKELNDIFRAGLLRIPGDYEFFIRDKDEESKLAKEIEETERGGTLFDIKTVITIDDLTLKGVQAYLYGRVLESTLDNKKALCRVSLTLAEIKSNKLLWSGNIVGEYLLPTKQARVSEEILAAAINAGNKAHEELKRVLYKLPNANIFILPLLGELSRELSDTITGKLILTGHDKLAFFSTPANPQNNRFVKALARELSADGNSTLGIKAIGQMMQQLEQVFDIGFDGKGTKNKQPSAKIKKENLYLTTNIKDIDYNKNTVSVAFTLRNSKNNQILWGTTVIGKEEGTLSDKLLKFFKDNIIFISGIIIILLGGFFFKLTNQAR